MAATANADIAGIRLVMSEPKIMLPPIYARMPDTQKVSRNSLGVLLSTMYLQRTSALISEYSAKLDAK